MLESLDSSVPPSFLISSNVYLSLLRRVLRRLPLACHLR